MNTFIDINTGTAYCGDKPYVFWFEDGQSTNINYVKTICFYCDKQSVQISCNSPIFKLLEMLNIYTPVQINDHSYYNLEDLKRDTLTSTGELVGDKYVHIIYILTQSLESGEVIDTFSIDDEEYFIGADFYNINEILKSNLKNLEIEIPESVQRAIYEKDIHEESNDNILLNRKYKELLMNYMDIVGKKGSYSSLINSLNWFEWGDLVRIEEAWKLKEPLNETLRLEMLNRDIDEYMMNAMSYISKSTYIGIYCALYNIKKDEYDDEGNPVLDRIATKWSLDDLCLKMTLLGNFYSTFFMPIHLDLIHSTVESWVFTNAIKLLNAGHQSRLDTINLINTIELNIEYE